MIKLKHLIMFLLAALTLAACASQVTPQATLEADEAEPVETSAPTVAPPPRPASATDNCLECHTDKNKLIALAVAEEDAGESESEGVG